MLHRKNYSAGKALCLFVDWKNFGIPALFSRNISFTSQQILS